eukprot:scaffold52386_cov17-Prasinocladus_malaysianus.AAC.1
MVSKLEAISTRLEAEEDLRRHCEEQLKDAELEMSSISRHLAGTQATLTETLQRATDAEARAASAEFELETGAAKIKELEEALQLEVSRLGSTSFNGWQMMRLDECQSLNHEEQRHTMFDVLANSACISIMQ